MKLEVIAIDLADIKAINQSNADRIEYCIELARGGFTPLYADIQAATNQSKLPVNVMLRPHDQGYVYSDEDFNLMLADAKFIATTQAAGVVFGILTAEKTVDIKRMSQLIEILQGKNITFHKAFDEIEDQQIAIKVLADLGVSTILTAGTGDIDQSHDLLASLKGKTTIKILGGGGVTFANAQSLMPFVDELHVGTAIRQTKSWDAPISIEKINELKTLIK